ncbi:MAG: TRAP transporter small permease [Cardiobacteriaceae bacterium]|nr:TRAP transporter small permease [Cardiobacteriaceae bacterium]
MKTILKFITTASIAVAALLLIVNVSVVMYGVITRYVVGGAPIWTDELARYAMIATAMLAMGGVWLCGEHMRVSLAERFLPAHLTRIVVFYQWLLTLAIALVGCWLTWRYAWSVSMFRSQGLGISRTLPMLSMPAGFALFALAVLLRGPKALPQQTGE